MEVPSARTDGDRALHRNAAGACTGGWTLRSARRGRRASTPATRGLRAGWGFSGSGISRPFDPDHGPHHVTLPGPKRHGVVGDVGRLDADHPRPLVVAEVRHDGGLGDPRVPYHRGRRVLL